MQTLAFAFLGEDDEIEGFPRPDALGRDVRLRGHVAYAEVSSPHTYQRYTYNHQGAGYGALVGKDARAHLFHYDFPIKGIHFLSAWVAGPTYEAAFGYAEMMAQTYQCA